MRMLTDDRPRAPKSMATALRDLPQQPAVRRRPWCPACWTAGQRPGWRGWSSRRWPLRTVAGLRPSLDFALVACGPARGRGLGEPRQLGRQPPAAADRVILKGYPRLSETFIAQEILGLEQARAGLRLISRCGTRPTRDASDPRPRSPPRCAICRNTSARRAAARVARLVAARRLPGYGARGGFWLADPPATARATGCAASARPACWRPSCRPTSTGSMPTSCTRRPRSRAMPRDDARPALERLGPRQGHLDDARLGKAREAGRSAAGHLHPPPAPAPGGPGAGSGSGGAGLSRARPRALSAARRPAGRRATAAIRAIRCVLLSVGRLVAKKGYDDLLRRWPAARRPHWRLVHIGGGELRTRSSARRPPGLGDRIDWRGAAAPGRGAGGLCAGRPVRAGQPRSPRTATATACPTC